MTSNTPPHSPEHNDGRSSRMEREISEILSRSGNLPQQKPIDLRRKRREKQVRRSLSRASEGLTDVRSTIRRVPPVVLAVAIAFIAFLLRDTSPFAARVLVVAAFLALVSPFILPRLSRRGGTGSQKKIWRGREFDQ